MCERVCLCMCVKVRVFSTPAAKRKKQKSTLAKAAEIQSINLSYNFIFEHLNGMRNEEVEIQSSFEILVKNCVGGNGKFVHSFNEWQNKSNLQ